MTTQKGKSEFTQAEAAKIEKLLFEIRRLDRELQKPLRDQLRKLEFYITDHTKSTQGFTVAHFKELKDSGRIKIR